MIEPPEVLVLGPYMTNIDGKPGTVRPRWAWAPSRQASASALPPAPRTAIGAMNSVGRKPVLQMMQSNSRSRPSAVRIPVGGQLGDRVGDQLDVGPRQRGQVVRAEQHPLAAEGVVGPDLGPQLGVGELAAHEQRRAREPIRAQRAGMADHQGQRLAVVEHPAPAQPLDRRAGARSASAGAAGSGGSRAGASSCRCAG